MKSNGFSDLSRQFSEDRFHVQELRARQRERDVRNVPGQEFVEEFVLNDVGGKVVANEFVKDFGGYQMELQDDLSQAFDLYLARGAAPRLFAPGLLPMPVLMDKAMHHVAAAFPRYSPQQIQSKAVEMLHNLNLDECQGRPHHERSEWAEEYHQQHHHGLHEQEHHHHRDAWAEEMAMEDAYAQRGWTEEFREEEFEGLERAYEREKWVEEFKDHVESKRAQELEDDGWFEEFLEKEKALQANSLKQITAKLGAIDDPKLQNSNFMSFVKEFAANNGAHPSQWQRRDDNWVEEFADVFDDRRSAPATVMRQEGGVLEEYQFAQDNPLADVADPFRVGEEFFNAGRFADAVLALEAAVLRSPKDGRAWHLLGKAHQEGDKDWQAIAALQRATQCDPSNLLGLVDQAVSYTNNMQKDRAMASLEAWLRNNPLYSHLAPPPLVIGSGDPNVELRRLYERQDVLIDCFVEAAQTNPSNVDPDVQICLGLLYSLSLEYDNAAQCFQAALSKREEDYALWNKLGATLANGGRSEEALQAYFQALERKPLYVRARANLGISFMAMKMYVDAAKQFLAALSIEPNAVHIWSNLETSFSYMERPDLIDKAKHRDVAPFKKDFDF